MAGGGLVSRRVSLLLGGAATLAVAWVWVHTSAWEPAYRQAPPERPQQVRHQPTPLTRIIEPPAGACTPPPGLRDGAYTCAYVVDRSGAVVP